MKTWLCDCGTQVYFDNTVCINCGCALGYDPVADRMRTLYPADDAPWRDAGGRLLRYCHNQQEFQVCNWLLEVNDANLLCRSCALNEMLPALVEPKRRRWWASMEAAKRRLVYSLLRHGLPVETRAESPRGLGFAFLEDRRSNPWVSEEYVPTGHDKGLITVNLAEADDVHRERTRVALGEGYRTLLGHFRHESGHYYFDRLVWGSPLHDAFRSQFGDDAIPYDKALESYYALTDRSFNTDVHISIYATSHPLEDWAECWAHYLHIVDTLETAAAYGFVGENHAYEDIDQWMPQWTHLSLALNGLNRSMGMQDAYPFVLGSGVIEKLRLVEAVVRAVRPRAAGPN